jgi:glycosyltransferase 2 family protein
MKKHTLVSILGFAISILFLYLTLKGLEFREIWGTLRKADPSLAFVPLLFIASAICLSSFRWSRISGSDVHFKETLVALMIGMFVNNVLPARLGEVARGYVLSRKKNLSFTYSLSTVLLDRFFDLTGLLVLVFAFFPKASLPPRVSVALFIIMGLLVACVLLMIFLSRESVANHISSKVASLEKSLLTRFAKRLMEVQENLRRISSPLTIIYFVALSFLTWLSMSVALYVVIRALGVSVPFVCVPFVCALLNLGIIIPSSPGYIGVYQYLIVSLLGIFGVGEAQAFAVSVLYHASWFLPYTIVGFLLFLKEHLKIKEIQRLAPNHEDS